MYIGLPKDTFTLSRRECQAVLISGESGAGTPCNLNMTHVVRPRSAAGRKNGVHQARVVIHFRGQFYNNVLRAS